MRDAYRGLTLRGRAFVAAGGTALVCAMFFQTPGLAAIGVFLLALPLLTVLWLGTGAQQVTLTRALSRAAVPVGQSVEVTLSVRNDGPMARGTLLLEDKVGFALGARPRFVVDDLDRNVTRTLRYQVRADVRGRYLIGPLTVRINDGLGLVDMARSFTGSAALIVTPRPVRLPPVALRAEVSGSGDTRPRSFAVGSAEDVTVRDYRRGDDLRRVHWRSTARVGELMVRREERPWQARATVLLDNRVDSHRGAGAASSLEPAVTAAASVASHLLQAGFSTRLVTAAGATSGTGFSAPGSSDLAIMESLAMTPAIDLAMVDLSWLGDYDSGGLVIAVVAGLSQADAAVMRRLSSHAGTCLALVVDTAGAESARDTVRLLDHSGWRAARIGRGERIEQGWRETGLAQLSRRVTS
ncbi:MAG: DUF58 domain-containing protein [Nocardioides sp.]